MSADDVRRLALGVLLPGFEGTHLEGPPGWLRALLSEGLAGVTVFGRNITHEVDAGLAALTAQLRRDRPDLLVAIDEEGGDVTRLDAVTGSWFPGQGTLGALDDVGATRDCHRMLAARLARCGVNLNFAPVADLASEPDSPIVGTRAFSADPAVAARHIAASLAGHRAAGVAPVVKHFPGHGATTEDSHLVVPNITASAETLRARELVPFVEAIRVGAPAIMTGHLRVVALDPERPATLSKRVITDLLRGELGFDGVVVTDGLDMHAISQTVGRPEATVQALAAGVDLICIGGDSVDAQVVADIVAAVTAAVSEGRLPLGRLREAEARVRKLAREHPARRTSGVTEVDVDALLDVARRSRRAVGDPSLPWVGAVVELVNDPSIVAGEVAFGVGAHLRGLTPSVRVLRLRQGDPLPVLADEGLVVSVRDSHLHTWQQEVLAELRRRHPDLVVVDHGATADAALLGDRAVVLADSSAAGSAVAAELILAGRSRS